MNQRSTTLTVLCVLSGIWITITLYSLTTDMSRGPLNPEEVEDQKSMMMEQYTEEQVKQMEWVFDDTFEFYDIMMEKLYLIDITLLINALIGLLGVIMMFKLRKTGFYIYVIYTIVPIALALILYPGLFKAFFAIYHILIGGLFVLLYGIQIKKLD